MRTLLVSIVAATALMSGCATRYPNALDKNLTVRLKLEKNGGLLTSANAVVGITEFGKDCSPDYKGYVDLAQGVNEVGLATGRPILVVLEIAHSSPGHRSSVKTGGVITLKAGARYLMEASYVNAMYNMKLYEVSPDGKRPLPLLETVPGCKT